MKNSKLGVKFIRQYSTRNWIVDIYCPKLKLVIEVDGGIHQKQRLKDLNRDETLKTIGIKTIRLKNQEIEGNIEKAKAKIISYICMVSPSTVPFLI